MKRVAAFVLAGGRSEALATLTVPRSIAAVPFAGKYRFIDFTLSNCVNSELYKVAVLTQYAPLSLSAHLGRGEPWDLNRRDGGVTLLQPYARQEGARWYEGTADAIRQNLDVLETLGADRVFVISTDVLCKMDYSWIFDHQRQTGARATLVMGRVPYGEVGRFGVSHLDEEDRILDFEEKPAASDAPWGFMGVYLFETAYLVSLLREQAGSNLILDVMRPRLRDAEVRAYRFEGYWDDIGTLPEYYRAHQRLLGDDPAPDLYDPEWRIYARSAERSPVLFGAGAEVVNSLVSNGAMIAGRVESSVLSPGVTVGRGAMVRDSIVLDGTVIGPGSRVERAVIDKNVVVGEGSRIGGPDSSGPQAGLTLVGKWAVLPSGSVIEQETIVPCGEVKPEAPRVPGGIVP